MTPTDQSLIVSITVKDANAALEYYQKSFNAEALFKLPLPDGSLGHADVRIGNTMVHLSGEYPDWRALSPETLGGSPNLLCIRHDDYETMFQQAVDNGAEVLAPMTDFPWGIRSGVIIDPFGYRWSIGKQVEVVSPEEVMQRLAGQS